MSISNGVKFGLTGLLLCAVSVVALSGCGKSADADVPQLEGYNLLWHDEFDGKKLDAENWNVELREVGWTNNELQAYVDTDENIYVQDGVLTLKAIETVDENGKKSYTSGKVNSQGLRDFTYGKVVARAKSPEGQGLWPAIWMMPQDESFYGQWPKCGEIDIMEVLGNETNKAYCTLHYGEPHGEQQGTKVLSDGTFASDFHDYSVEWEPGEIRWYIDDELILTANDWFSCVDGEEDKPYPAPFDQPFFVQMNLAVGGNWPGDPDDTTDFENAKFEIDYVRVYQKSEYDTNVSKPEVVMREPNADGNYVNNADFAVEEDLTDEVDWNFLLFTSGIGSAEITDNSIVITTKDDGDKPHSVQLVQREMPMKKGHSYKVTFDAKASGERKMQVCVSAPNAGWVRYLEDTDVELTTDWQTYEYDFTMTKKSDPTGRLEFNMGDCDNTTETIYITNVRLEEVQ